MLYTDLLTFNKPLESVNVLRPDLHLFLTFLAVLNSEEICLVAIKDAELHLMLG
ncbi:hypothetical protein U703_01925 [Rhodobacter capsulatus YW1]|nr:hypothetical protein U703_01925 [Rhodobacter capsulatus YW1]